jgi:Cof subfamily protein (haloacid dehalogenase superfamily)
METRLCADPARLARAQPPMSQPIRLLVSDIDGTLVTTDKLLTPATIAAASQLEQAGIAVALVSSRPPRGIMHVAEQLGSRLPIAGFNGASVLDADGRMLADLLVPEHAAEAALAAFEQRAIDAWLFADGQWLLTDPDGTFVPLERRTIGFEPTIVTDLAPYAGRAGKLVGASADRESLIACETELQLKLGATATAHRSQAYYLDITHPQADKGYALRSFAGMLGLEAAEVACIGDMTNDLPMFDVAGFAIAMGNAPPDVQVRAHAVTRSNDDDGFAAAVRDLLMPRAPKAPASR